MYLTYVLSRRRKTLLWLDDHPERPENVRIRLGIPGHSNSQELVLDEHRCSIAADNKDIALEDQVDVTLFTSVDAIEAFLRHPSQQKFTKYPPSLFRIVTNRRLFVGPSGLSARMSKDPKWKSAFPAMMVFHGHCDDGLDAYKGRPNLKVTQDADQCTAFVSFQSAEVAALKAMDVAASAPTRVLCTDIFIFIVLCQGVIICTTSLCFMIDMRHRLPVVAQLPYLRRRFGSFAVKRSPGTCKCSFFLHCFVSRTLFEL